MKNIFENIPTELPEELFEVICESAEVRVERIVSKGHASPTDFWYDQEEDELVFLLKGSAQLSFRDTKQSVIMKAGDYINIPAHQAHRVDWTADGEETVWLAIFYRD